MPHETLMKSFMVMSRKNSDDQRRVCVPSMRSQFWYQCHNGHPIQNLCTFVVSFLSVLFWLRSLPMSSQVLHKAVKDWLLLSVSCHDQFCPHICNYCSFSGGGCWIDRRLPRSWRRHLSFLLRDIVFAFPSPSFYGDSEEQNRASSTILHSLWKVEWGNIKIYAQNNATYLHLHR